MRKQRGRVLGVDPSTKKLAIIGTRNRDKQEPEAWTIKLPNDVIDRCGEAFNAFGGLLYDLTQQSDGVAPRVYLEAPVLGRGGPHSTISQSQVGGAVMAACSEYRCPLVLVNNASWKKQVCGNGGFGKPEIYKAMRSVWPEAFELANGDQDLVDASAIYLFGQAHTDAIRRVKIKRMR